MVPLLLWRFFNSCMSQLCIKYERCNINLIAHENSESISLDLVTRISDNKNNLASSLLPQFVPLPVNYNVLWLGKETALSKLSSKIKILLVMFWWHMMQPKKNYPVIISTCVQIWWNKNFCVVTVSWIAVLNHKKNFKSYIYEKYCPQKLQRITESSLLSYFFT